MGGIMDKLKRRVILATVIFTLITIATTSGFSIIYMFSKMKSNTDKFLLENAKSYSSEMNGIIIGMETTVESLTKSISAVIDADEVNNPAYYDTLYPTLKALGESFKYNNINATSLYIRFDPKLSHGTAGVFFVDTNNDYRLEEAPPTDITLYDKTDRERVAWFYEPIEAQKPIWTKPYYNANVKKDMISYIAPLTVKGVTIGVVGVDIDFDRLRAICNERKGIGKVLLLDEELHFLVHDTYSFNDQIQTIENGQFDYIANLINKNSRGIIDYTIGNEDRILGFSKTQNNWTIILSMTEKEAFYDLNQSLVVLGIFIGGITLLIIFVSVISGRYFHRLYTKNETLETMVQLRTNELENTIESLNTMQTKLIMTEKLASLGGIITGIAHEINTPLGNSITVLSHMKDQTNTFYHKTQSKQLSLNNLQSYLDQIKNTTELLEISLRKIKHLIDTFKLLSNYDVARNIQEIHMATFLDELIYDLTGNTLTAPYAVEIHCDAALRILSSPEVLREILSQLIKNSVQHGFHDQPYGQITLSVVRENDKIILFYADEGAGVSQDVLPTLFEPFYTTKRNRGHIGLGLHIVHNLVTQTLEGDIHLYPNEPKGLLFKIEFPDSRKKSL